MYVRSPIRFKRMPESNGSSYDYLRRIYVPRYFVAAFSKLFNYKIFGHNFTFFSQLFRSLSFFFFFLFSSNSLYFFLIIIALSSIFHKFYAHITYNVYTHICALCTKLTKTQNSKNINFGLYPLKNRTKSRNFTIFLLKKALICLLKCQKIAVETSKFVQFSWFSPRYKRFSAYYYLDRYCMNI